VSADPPESTPSETIVAASNEPEQAELEIEHTGTITPAEPTVTADNAQAEPVVEQTEAAEPVEVAAANENLQIQGSMGESQLSLPVEAMDATDNSQTEAAVEQTEPASTELAAIPETLQEEPVQTEPEQTGAIGTPDRNAALVSYPEVEISYPAADFGCD
jgi:hypothetical protein